MMTIVVELVFWVCVALIGYAYVLYPIALWGLSHVFGRAPACDWPADADLPPVSVLIAAHNEEKVIADRIANALALDYPPDRLEIVIASARPSAPCAVRSSSCRTRIPSPTSMRSGAWSGGSLIPVSASSAAVSS
jgi:cellulose synthase/poly-beta-1,6-N-acetylglucosamine synthase-like glycosyltransferase